VNEVEVVEGLEENDCELEGLDFISFEPIGKLTVDGAGTSKILISTGVFSGRIGLPLES
jgi:hypothetical protein